MMDPTYQEYLDESRHKKTRTSEFLGQLKDMDKKRVLQELYQAHNEVFKEVDCLACANCCKTSPPLVTKSDINRIAGFLGLTPREFARRYVMEDVNGEWSFNSVPCRFLADDNHCRIYEVRPEACRRYPHTDEEDFVRRRSLNLANTLICPAAYRIIIFLQNRLTLLP